MNQEKIDAAARALCRVRNQNPDESVMDENAHHDYAGFVPRWMNARDEVIRHLQLNEAIREAML